MRLEHWLLLVGVIPPVLPVAHCFVRKGLASHSAPLKSGCQAERMILGRVCLGEPQAGVDVSFSAYLIPADG